MSTPQLQQRGYFAARHRAMGGLFALLFTATRPGCLKCHRQHRICLGMAGTQKTLRQACTPTHTQQSGMQSPSASHLSLRDHVTTQSV